MSAQDKDKVIRGRFNLTKALNSLKSLLDLLESHGPGAECDDEMPYISIKVGLSWFTGETENEIQLTPEWFMRLFDGQTVGCRSPSDCPEFLSLTKRHMGILWTTCGPASELAPDGVDLRSAHSDRGDREGALSLDRLSKELADDDSPIGLNRPLPAPIVVVSIEDHQGPKFLHEPDLNAHVVWRDSAGCQARYTDIKNHRLPSYIWTHQPDHTPRCTTPGMNIHQTSGLEAPADDTWEESEE